MDIDTVRSQPPASAIPVQLASAASLNCLPDALIASLMMNYLGGDTASLAGVSRRFRKIAQETCVWPHLCRKLLGGGADPFKSPMDIQRVAPNKEYNAWRRLYSFRIRGREPWIGTMMEGQHTSRVIQVTPLTNESIATGSQDGTACIWSATRERICTLINGGYVAWIIPCEGGSLLTGAYGGAPILWSADSTNGKVFGADNSPITCMTALPGGRIAMGIQSDKTVRVWSNRHELLATLKGHNADVRTIVPLHGQRIATICCDGTAHIWSAEGEVLTTLTLDASGICHLIVLKDGRLATSSYENAVRLLSDQGAPLAVLRKSSLNPKVYKMIALPCGGLAIVLSDHTVHIFSTYGEEIAVLQGHSALISCIITLEDGRLVTGSYDRTVCIWSLQGRLLAHLTNESGVTSMESLPGGHIVTGLQNGKVVIWSHNLKPLLGIERDDYPSRAGSSPTVLRAAMRALPPVKP